MESWGRGHQIPQISGASFVCSRERSRREEGAKGVLIRVKVRNKTVHEGRKKKENIFRGRRRTSLLPAKLTSCNFHCCQCLEQNRVSKDKVKEKQTQKVLNKTYIQTNIFILFFSPLHHFFCLWVGKRVAQRPCYRSHLIQPNTVLSVGRKNCRMRTFFPQISWSS